MNAFFESIRLLIPCTLGGVSESSESRYNINISISQLNRLSAAACLMFSLIFQISHLSFPISHPISHARLNVSSGICLSSQVSRLVFLKLFDGFLSAWIAVIFQSKQKYKKTTTKSREIRKLWQTICGTD